ncbi:hypothetical protein D3C87_1650250 [compost metagenome]
MKTVDLISQFTPKSPPAVEIAPGIVNPGKGRAKRHGRDVGIDAQLLQHRKQVRGQTLVEILHPHVHVKRVLIHTEMVGIGMAAQARSGLEQCDIVQCAQLPGGCRTRRAAPNDCNPFAFHIDLVRVCKRSSVVRKQLSVKAGQDLARSDFLESNLVKA